MDWLDLLHLADSAFPSGAYVHSFGLETLAPASVAELELALTMRLEEVLARLELVFVLHGYTHPWRTLDRELHARLLARETREASASIGTAFLRAVCELLDDVALKEFLRDGPYRHHPIAWGAVACVVEVPSQLAAEAYAFNALRGQVSAAQRLGWLGQREAQRVLHALKPGVRAAAIVASRLPLDKAGAFAPAWDIASMVHEHADIRLFAS